MRQRAFLSPPLCFSLFLFIIFHLLLFLYQNAHGEVLDTASAPFDIVLDIGHGGSDPGKVGTRGVYEKDINLSIGHYLYQYLNTAGYQTAMTRFDDKSLADSSASNQKLSDFKNRVAFIEKCQPSLVVSIHQNSFPDESVQGTQVFHASDASSAHLALCIQEQCRRILNPDNHRQIKEDMDYYLFRHVSCPIVIVECGFLSNPDEAALLTDPSYQNQTAWAIYMGILQYLKTNT